MYESKKSSLLRASSCSIPSVAAPAPGSPLSSWSASPSTTARSPSSSSLSTLLPRYLSIYLSTHLSIYLYTHLSIHYSIYLYIYPYFKQFIFQSIFTIFSLTIASLSYYTFIIYVHISNPRLPPPWWSRTTPSWQPTPPSSTPTAPSWSTTRPSTISAAGTSILRGPAMPTSTGKSFICLSIHLSIYIFLSF